jgi:hypothetical protein
MIAALLSWVSDAIGPQAMQILDVAAGVFLGGVALFVVLAGVCTASVMGKVSR